METHISSLNFHDMLVFLGVAALLVPLLRSVRFHTVLAFLLAGVMLGPYGLGTWFDPDSILQIFVVQNTEHAAALAEIGIVLLLFLIGLELSLERLWNMRQWIFGLGSAQLILCALPIGVIAWYFGNSHAASILLGVCLALSSTAIVMQLINEQKALGSPLGQASFSILLLQDLAVVPLLLLVGLLSTQQDVFMWNSVLIPLGKALLVILLILLSGHWLLRPLFRWVLTYGHSEAFIALILLVAIGTAVLTSLAGLSLALGAFLAGLVLAETQYSHEIETKLESFNGLLMGLFFMSVGMSINTTILLKFPLLIVLSITGLMLIKAIVVSLLLRWQGFPWSDASRGGLLLSQAGEFGFIVIGMATALKLLDQPTGQFMLFVVSGSMFLTPLINELGIWLQKYLSMREKKCPANHDTNLPLQQHVLIAGCGRVGKLVAHVLSSEEQPWLAIERSASRVEQLREQGFPVIYGDVTRGALLRKLHAEKACAVVVTVDDMTAAEKTVVAVRKNFPHTPIYARARDKAHARRLLQRGATQVIPDAVEAGLQLAGLTLQSIGVPEDACQRILATQREKELSALAKPDPADPR